MEEYLHYTAELSVKESNASIDTDVVRYGTLLARLPATEFRAEVSDRVHIMIRLTRVRWLSSPVTKTVVCLSITQRPRRVDL